MSYPPGYTPTTSFVNDETNQVSGRSTVRTVSLDVELANISASVTALKANLQAVQRDDNKLRDFLVEPYALSEQTRAFLAAKGLPRGIWSPGVAYAVGDLVQYLNVALQCYTAHTSTNPFNAGGFWIAISGDGSAALSAVTAQNSAASAANTAASAIASAGTATAASIAASASASDAGNSATTASNSAASATAGSVSAANSASVALGAATSAQTSGSAIALKSDLANTSDPAKGTALVGFLQAGTGAIGRTAQSKERDTVSVKDFGAVGDGVANDTVAIQKALDSGANVIKITPGTYLHGLLTLPSGVSIEGAGGMLKMIAGQRFGLQLPNPSVNSTIEGVTFDASGMGGTAGVREERSVITTTPGVVGGTLTGLIIKNCRFLDGPVRDVALGSLGQIGHSIQLVYGEATVTGNYTNQCGGDCYNFNNGYFIVTGNTAKNVGDGGVAFNNNARGVIANNYFYKCSLGIGSGPQGTTASPDNDFAITGNTMRACDYGINMGWFAFAGTEGPRNVSITGNTIAGFKTCGIRYDGNSAASYGLMTVSGNSISRGGVTDYDGTTGTGDAIHFGYTAGSTISNNTISECTGFGIYSYSPKCSIIGNTLTFVTGSAIVTGGNGCIIMGNRISFVGAVGIHVDFLQTQVIGNQVSDCAAGAGIYINNVGTDVVVQLNEVISCLVGIQALNANTGAAIVAGFNVLSGTTTATLNFANAAVFDRYTDVYFNGTTAADGAFTQPHGLGSPMATYRVVTAQAFWKGASGEAVPMVIKAIDGSNVYCTSSAVSKPCRLYLRLAMNAPAW